MADRRALAVALALIAGFMLVELVAGVLAGSLALLADAGHMLSDAGALALALFAAWMAAKPATPTRSFGYRRVEILAALANGVALVAIAIWIVIEAVRRLGDPPEPVGAIMLAVGVAGLVVNLAAARVLSHGHSESLNRRAALRHVLADLLGSIGVLAAAAVIVLTGWVYADPLVSLGIAVLVLASSWSVLSESTSILLEGTPRGLDTAEIGQAMVDVSGVREVHDLHVWTITSGFPSLSAHVLVAPGDDCHAKRRELERVLEERFGLTHTTLQVDHAQDQPALVDLGTPYRRREPL